MKYAILVGDGMADWPLESLGGQTPLEKAAIPNMDKIAAAGKGGRAATTPKGLEPGSDVAALSILGFDPKECYTGRGPFEAESYGVDVAEDEIAFRCNFVDIGPGNTMEDYSAGHISTAESAKLIRVLNEKIADEGIKFYTGVSYRNLTIIKGKLLGTIADREDLVCVPPHDISGKSIDEYMPKGKGAEEICSIMRRSREVLGGGKMAWLWGWGKRPQMPSFQERFGLSSGIISAVGLLKGIGKTIGMEIIEVPGATGYYDTDYGAKARYAIEAFKRLDLVLVHVEAPDEAGHNGDLENKIRAIENFDGKVVGPILEYLRSIGNYRVLVLPDHATPVEARTHVHDPVPFAICGNGIEADSMTCFTERESDKGWFGIVAGNKLINLLIMA